MRRAILGMRMTSLSFRAARGSPLQEPRQLCRHIDHLPRYIAEETAGSTYPDLAGAPVMSEKTSLRMSGAYLKTATHRSCSHKRSTCHLGEPHIAPPVGLEPTTDRLEG